MILAKLVNSNVRLSQIFAITFAALTISYSVCSAAEEPTETIEGQIIMKHTVKPAEEAGKISSSAVKEGAIKGYDDCLEKQKMGFAIDCLTTEGKVTYITRTLWVKWKIKCYPGWVEEYWEAKVTGDGEKERNVDKIEMKFSGPFFFKDGEEEKVCKNTSFCAQTVKGPPPGIYGCGNLRVGARATDQYGTWSVGDFF